MYNSLHLYTHDGLFHADDVFATALISLMTKEYDVTRGPDTEIPEDKTGWIIFDIGGGEFDHHSPENKEANGCHPNTDIPYAACGLIWKKYYQEILEAIDCPEEYYEKVYVRLENTLIAGIDAFDNGYNPVAGAMEEMPNIPDDQKKKIVAQGNYAFSISQVIKDFNPGWNSDYSYYEAFLDAVSFAKDILMNRLDSIISSLDGRDYVLQCISFSSNHLMIMDQFAPWEGVLNSQKNDPKAKDIYYVIYPALRGGWNIQCALNNSDDRTSYRHPLPSEWYGLRYEELAKVSGVETAQFCHVSGFLAGCKTQSDALKMASIALSRK